MNKFDLIEQLREIEEITLMELLELTSNDLVDAFLDVIDDNQGKLIAYLDDQ